MARALMYFRDPGKEAYMGGKCVKGTKGLGKMKL
jgi:hypothetical protein